MAGVEFNLFLPQMRMSFDQLVTRAQAAEAAGFVGVTGMDHLAPPLALDQPMYEAIVTTTWLAAHTQRINVGSLVLCDGFRLPTMLAREAVSLDHASGGRFELGLGWGSVVEEFTTFGVGSTQARDRADRMRESLEVITALWSGETVDYAGHYHTLAAARQVPVPLSRIPIVIGGVGKKTLKMVHDFADWWNVHVGHIGRIEELRSEIGSARVSIQHMVALITDESRREEITATVRKRFAYSRPIIGTANEIVDYFAGLNEQGVERVYAWFCDFAPPETLAAFGAGVISQMR